MITKPSFGKEDPKIAQIRTQFIENFQPKDRTPKPKEINPDQDWDFDLLDRLKALQEGGS